MIGAGSSGARWRVLTLGACLGVVLSACSGTATTPTAPSATAMPVVTASAQAASPTAGATLRSAAGRLLIGTAVGLPQMNTDSAYAATLAAQFNSITAENAMKWAVVEPTQGTYDWTGADQIVAFAEAHDQKVRGHTLVWYNQLPDWLTSGTFTAAQLSDLLKTHISTEVGRYAGRVYAWDVVNEPLDDNGGMRSTIWYDKLGQQYIADAFTWARAADPTAKLYVNDYNIAGINSKSDALYSMVKALKAQGVPIDGIGIQGHLSTQYGFPAGIADNIARFADLGLEVTITEADVRMKLPATPFQQTTQADYYRQLFAACAGNKACVGVTVWGFDDKYSWIPATFSGEGAADLFDEGLNPKAAFQSVLKVLQSQ
jgi:endo-1,4-beta-xylanase